jgi:uncharacterized protein YndB with AHSA1/START domain
MSPFAEADASVGARLGSAFTIVMRGQGQAIRHIGTCLEFDPPHRLAFTWRSPYTGGGRFWTTWFACWVRRSRGRHRKR